MKKGLCLGAGGVKGFVHLGVLEFLFENDVRFDMVCGSSIGSVVGAMYAMGQTPRQMLKNMVISGIADPKKFISARLKKDGIVPLLRELTGGRNFENLAIPFKAVAVDLYTGVQVNFESGSLPLALGASCAIPPYVRPVKINGATYVDGAFSDSVPADVLKKMGADKILSVNLSYGRVSNKKSKAMLDAIYPSNNVKEAFITSACYEYSDLIIEPDIRAYKAFDFSNSVKLFDIGYDEAKKLKDKILEFK